MLDQPVTGVHGRGLLRVVHNPSDKVSGELWTGPTCARSLPAVITSNRQELWIGGRHEDEVRLCCRGCIDGSVSAEPSGR